MKQLFLTQVEPRVHFNPIFTRLPHLEKAMAWLKELNFPGEIQVAIDDTYPKRIVVEQMPRGIRVVINDMVISGLPDVELFTVRTHYFTSPPMVDAPAGRDIVRASIIQDGDKIGHEYKEAVLISSLNRMILAKVCKAMAEYYGRQATIKKSAPFWRKYAYHLYRHYVTTTLRDY